MESTAQDDAYMRQALRLAARGRGRTSPNPMVGAIVVDGRGAVVGSGYHERAGGDHAEVRALAEAGEAARGATLYCTLEPCCHHGRTGPCVERIVEAALARVVVAMPDPNPVVNGRGIAHLRGKGIAVDVGLRKREAARLNEAFVTWVSRRRPFVTMKVATSLDGCIAARPGARTALTSPAAGRAVHALRGEVDAIGVGSTTVLVDDPLLTARGTVEGAAADTGRLRSPVAHAAHGAALRDAGVRADRRSDVGVGVRGAPGAAGAALPTPARRSSASMPAGSSATLSSGWRGVG